MYARWLARSVQESARMQTLYCRGCEFHSVKETRSQSFPGWQRSSRTSFAANKTWTIDHHLVSCSRPEKWKFHRRSVFTKFYFIKNYLFCPDLVRGTIECASSLHIVCSSSFTAEACHLHERAVQLRAQFSVFWTILQFYYLLLIFAIAFIMRISPCLPRCSLALRWSGRCGCKSH